MNILKREDLNGSGYGAFSVSQSHREIVTQYIKRQREHHQRFTFQDEYLRLLQVYQVKYDEAYLWD